MDYLNESGVSIYRRRRRRRAVITMIGVSLVLLTTVMYAASYVQGWVGTPAPKSSVLSASCVPNGALKPREVTVNVYNSTVRTGLAATAATALEKQGFRVATVDNDPLGKTILNVGEVRAGPRGAAAALLVAKRLTGATVVQDDRADSSVDIVLGKTFKVIRVPPKVPASKAAKPAPGC